MKKIWIIVVMVTSFFYAHTGFSGDESNALPANIMLLMLQQKLQIMQAQNSPAAATEDVEIIAINIKGTYTGTAPGMNPSGNCLKSVVKLKIDKQCGNFAKGTITALGVTVPVTGTFKNNYLSLDGVKTGGTVWMAGMGAQYLGGNFLVSSFSFVKVNTALSNRYDTGWILKK
jgi:hypothetical protein